MKLIASIVIVLSAVQVYSYHDPDLNYHINQLQSLNLPKSNGYNYPVPAIQLTTSGIKLTGPTEYTGPNTFYPQPTEYSAPTYVPPSRQVAYRAPTPINYASSASTAQGVIHGYQTSAGLSTYTGAPRTVIPQATYAQAPIIAKITAAPLIAKYATAPAKSPFFNQNYISPNIDNPANPVVSQVIAANPVRYAASSALRVQPQYVASQTSVGFVPNAAAVSQYAAPVVAQYVQPQFHQFIPPPPPQFQVPKTIAPQVFAPAPVQYAAPVINPYTPAVQQLVPGHVVAKNVHTDFLENYDPHPRYSYSYNVHDPRTGDIKHQSEQRDGEVVKGQYSLVEPDGSVRTVDYVADWETGFHANVRNSKHNH